jgi:hypothetical protein
MKQPFLVRAMVAVAFVSIASGAQAQGVTGFNSIPSNLTANVPSEGFECCSNQEFGDEIVLAVGTPRLAGYVTVLMSDWAKNADYPAMSAAGFVHPVTLNIYTDAFTAAMHQPAATVTQSFLMPWRPADDPTCSDSAWRAADGVCYHGLAFEIRFDLRGLGYNLPDHLIYGVAYNTNTHGYHPLGVTGPYDSLNIGLATVHGVAIPPSVGTDVNPDVVYMNSSFGPFYTDGGAAGINVFRPDTGWSQYPIAVKFSTYGVPATSSDCKSGGWQSLVRSNFASFKNQGDCVSYVQTGR